MKIRAAILTLLLAAALGWFAFEQKRGGTQAAEEWFLDFLAANARDALSKDAPEESKDVVLVEIREEDKAEYSAWPPAPLDYIMILKSLAEHEPQVVAVVEPLRWEKADTQFVTQLRNALVPFPSVVLGFQGATSGAEMTPEQTEFAANEMPVLPAAEGERLAVPKFTHVTQLSDWSLRITTQAGISFINGAADTGGAMPFVAAHGKSLVPSLAAQSVTLFRRAPYAAQRLSFGTGARWSLGDALIIPLREDGSLPLKERPRVPVVNALELMTPDLGDETAKAAQATLGKGKLVVLGKGSSGMFQARGIASALAMPNIRRAPASAEWAFAGVACVFCFWQLRYRRMKALILGAAAIIFGLGICLLVFQSSLMWWPPLAGLLVMITGTLFCLLWPAERGSPAPVLSATEPPA